ncbi:MAG: membrane protein required for colicin V production [Paracoccaceae bacterium]|jgi:membrane protein required for colicin V production
MDFTLADGIVALILLVSGMLAWSRGFTREALAIGGWIFAGAAAIYLAPYAEPLIKEIPKIGPLLDGQCSLSKLAAFSVVFALGLIVISIFTPLFSSAVQDSPLGVLDRGLGFVFGVARGLALVAVAWLIYSLIVPPADRMPAVDNARSIALIAETSELMKAAMPTGIPSWIGGPINTLMLECGGVPALMEAPATGPAASQS